MTFSFPDFISSLQYLPNQPLAFQSVTFFILFAFFYLLYALSFNNRTMRNGVMLLFSLYFYYKISGLFVGVMVLMATVDYLVGIGIHKSKSAAGKKGLLVLSVIMNVGALLYFKYTNFLLETWTGFAHPGETPLVLQIVQPLGISYFVFKSLTYVFDMHREMIDEPERNWFRYVLYVSFFPNIMAGPISKARDLLPQFVNKPVIDKETLSKGLFLIMLGLIKKIVFADYLAANLVDRVYESPQFFTGLDAMMASYGGMLQIFFDFAGYTDMMVGFGFLMGITLEHNFNKPFMAGNITEFWRRWHITLYNWLNEYLYQPMAFAWRRGGKVLILLAVFITFFISGLWHGAALTFVVWGLLHGAAISWDVISQKGRAWVQKWMPKVIYAVISVFITFHFLVFSSVLLKVSNPNVNAATADGVQLSSIEKAQAFYNQMLTVDFSLFGQWYNIYSVPFFLMIGGLLLQYLPVKMYTGIFNAFVKLHWTLKSVALAVVIILLYQLYSLESMPFMYIQF
jgi:D-alanyl-lipoteichoic acid acyltransferase DltB (MBOAT superfamily)